MVRGGFPMSRRYRLVEWTPEFFWHGYADFMLEARSFANNLIGTRQATNPVHIQEIQPGPNGHDWQTVEVVQ